MREGGNAAHDPPAWMLDGSEIAPPSQAYSPGVPARTEFMRGWDQINGKRAPWASNPWVWVVEFEKEDAK